ncbi:flagellar biosynthesis protein FlaG [Heliobacillus mobilis]|uniref:Flagellar biosynthesis protein FlaG n=1 Tax=Heliobacterium mobile TaxID=28064 RepID=A0A6I3SNX3_HELMO|nr:flagellar protein FlaG [Heliobacterium mobile]MTV49937.1 flagellar biosynthesis protein FlaG [Heliobacterium mobile]
MELASVNAMDGGYNTSSPRVSGAESGASRNQAGGQTTDVSVNANTLQTDTLQSGATAPHNDQKESVVDLLAHESPYRFSKDTVVRMLQETNSFLQTINTDIRLQWHEKMEMMSVQVYDQRNNRVLREFPPKEFLDRMAKIRDFVGIVLDKKV